MRICWICLAAAGNVILQGMNGALSGLLCAMLLALTVAATVPLMVLAAEQEADWQVTAAEWARPRTGSSLLQHAGLRAAVSALAPGDILQIVHPGGDAGSLWAHELQGWLVALGLPSTRLDLFPGSQRQDVIELRIRAAGPSTEAPITGRAPEDFSESDE